MIRKLYSLFISLVITAGIIGPNILPAQANALSASDWQAGRIIDDSIFTNANSMSVDQIQTFLNNLVPNCDTYGTQPASDWGRSDLTHAQFATQVKGWPGPPYVCLRNYYEVPKTSPGAGIPDNSYNHNGNAPAGSISAAQMIYNAAQQYNISPKVLLIKIRSESSGPLTTDSWPLQSQYTYAMGAHCPDSGPGNTPNCDPNYAGFSIQISEAAALMRYYLDNMNQAWWPYKKLGNNTILYNPNTSCGSSIVNITTSATAALYTYTPYQPNAGALAAGYGTAPCGAYGNRNFWLYYNDWFGSTINDHLIYSVIQGPNSSALYLQTQAGKYYIPSGDLMKDWGIDKLPVQQVSQSYLDGLTTHGWLGRLLEDDWGNMFIVDNGQLHYVRDASYLPLWGLTVNDAVQSLGLAYSMPGTSWTGRFVQDQTQPNGTIWLMDNGQKHAVPTNMLYNWRYTPDQITPISTAYLNSMTTGSDATQYATNGSTNYTIDSGQKLAFPNADVQSAYMGSNTAVQFSAATLSFLPNVTASQFVINASTGQWFMLEAARKHYIGNADLATLWGKGSASLTTVSGAFLGSLTDGGNLTYVVQTSSPSRYWLIDGTKHYIPNSDVAGAWIAAGVSPPLYSSQSLDLLTQGEDATTDINGRGSAYVYTMDSGIKHYLSTPSARAAWGGTILNVSPQLVNNIPEGSFVNYTVKDTSGNAYLLMNSVLYSIDSGFYTDWRITASTPVMSDQGVSRYTKSTSILKGVVTANNITYLMTGSGNATPISQFSDAYTPSSLHAVTLPDNYFPTTAQASYLVKSSDSSDGRLWFINNGAKNPITFEQAVSYGYLSKGVQPTTLSPEVLALIPTGSQQLSLLIQKPGSGIKLLSFGRSLGFPDGPTLLSYIGGSVQVTQVAPSVFDSFALNGSTSRLIRDDNGNLFWMDSGSKHYILNGTIQSHYPATPQTYLEGTTQYLIPSGTPAQ